LLEKFWFESRLYRFAKRTLLFLLREAIFIFHRFAKSKNNNGHGENKYSCTYSNKSKIIWPVTRIGSVKILLTGEEGIYYSSYGQDVCEPNQINQNRGNAGENDRGLDLDHRFLLIMALR
jgi:hypothetical protein